MLINLFGAASQVCSACRACVFTRKVTNFPLYNKIIREPLYLWSTDMPFLACILFRLPIASRIFYMR